MTAPENSLGPMCWKTKYLIVLQICKSSFSSDEIVAAPWAKLDQRRSNEKAGEEISGNEERINGDRNEMGETTEEQWCGPPECDQRYLVAEDQIF